MSKQKCWAVIDWNKDVHKMTVCPCCGITADDEMAAGHASQCYYGDGADNAGAVSFLQSEIEAALWREKHVSIKGRAECTSM